MSEGDDDSGGGVGRDDMYNSSEKELILTSLSDSYSELKAISVSVSGPSSCSTLHCLLTT